MFCAWTGMRPDFPPQQVTQHEAEAIGSPEPAQVGYRTLPLAWVITVIFNDERAMQQPFVFFFLSAAAE